MEKKEDKICRCWCHGKGSSVMHMMACCEFTYEKYINSDGSVDFEIYNKLKNGK
jgi:hypothetical protein